MVVVVEVVAVEQRRSSNNVLCMKVWVTAGDTNAVDGTPSVSTKAKTEARILRKLLFDVIVESLVQYYEIDRWR